MNKPFRPGCQCSATPDGLLIQQTLQGDQEAFEYLVERYHPMLAENISSWCPDPYLVSDIEQNVLLRLYLSLPILHTDRPLKAWLLRVAYFSCLSERRREMPLLFSQCERFSTEAEYSWFPVLSDSEPLPEEVIEQRERQQVIIRAIRVLPVKQRVAVWLKYIEQLSYTEIAQRLHIPQGTAKTNVARAKLLLRRLLTEEVRASSRHL